ncbi:MAG: hypothetical protein JSR00_03605 [Bacteroidetes bacterium]|nr:hypothetical protein [Bacteroidota bacterium]
MNEKEKDLKIREMPHPGAANTNAVQPIKAAERYPEHDSSLEHQEKHFNEEMTLKKDNKEIKH